MTDWDRKAMMITTLHSIGWLFLIKKRITNNVLLWSTSINTLTLSSACIPEVKECSAKLHTAASLDSAMLEVKAECKNK